MATRHLYLTRHAEPDAAGALTERGVRQAELLGRRLRAIPFSTVSHGPSARTAGTARVVARELAGAPPFRELAAAGDYVPAVPVPDEVAPEHRAAVLAWFADVPAEAAAQGALLAAEALRLFTGPEPGTEPGSEDRHDLVVTHAFTVAWLVAQACGAPAWRWWGLNHGHAALTVLRYAPDRPPSLVVLNDMDHLPEELRWTGFPDHLRLQPRAPDGDCRAGWMVGGSAHP